MSIWLIKETNLPFLSQLGSIDQLLAEVGRSFFVDSEHYLILMESTDNLTRKGRVLYTRSKRISMISSFEIVYREDKPNSLEEYQTIVSAQLSDLTIQTLVYGTMN
ncbi:hypothetical protein PHYBLDRAFT_58238 [Phycomyces blakesleeanus NRRL 1555(-)]|uniref:Uncharacterized protein n=1 Tax=Phycomyces blakesleeanus (strain ATCC 8743b / DSM 1359 / FGSC 10004 / NBRC 33097 / NRRL 1555) TaxID=763407 RepID=A0A167Q749_PHYB8|nr:hypothetical protein PHYBLDRAFT_58238 [Phycomyces blakesleeanus NRRL 1555(-)]OAD79194.1 hypothetical protein PHYBLDRAFT_58238 [Phycomyces blakesleeanus NRRL 1555(-)]|eukprot:XP_018297234.1 hypothetical protein PHYBLDRAFT_58238 [Phycomyces blakesleeanus NRRL 1555(-)]